MATAARTFFEEGDMLLDVEDFPDTLDLYKDAV